MTAPVFVARGNGYQGCTCFDGYVPIASPLPGYSNAEREARVFRRKSGNGTDYGSHVIALATKFSDYDGNRHLYRLVEHGAGREVLAIPTFYDGGEYEKALLAMPERLQYAALYTLYRMARDAHDAAEESTASKYGRAFIEGRLKKSRPKQGRVTVSILPEASK